MSMAASGLTKAQADELYVNSTGTDQLNGSIVIIGDEQVNGIAKFNNVPMLNNNLSKNDIINPLHLTNKDYVDGRINDSVILSPTSWSFGMSSYTYQINNDYILETPYLGNNTTKQLVNSQFSKVFYINWPSQITEGGITKLNLKHGCWCDYTHSISMVNCVDMTGATGITNYNNEISRVKRSTPFTNADLDGTSKTDLASVAKGNSAFRTATGRVFLGIQNSASCTYFAYAFPSIYGSSNSQNPSILSHSYTPLNNLSGAVTMDYYVLMVQYVNNNKLKITMGFPPVANSPTNSLYFISEIAASFNILTSNPCDETHSTTTINATLGPNNDHQSKATNGGAYLSMS
jgi:hypothetical protein